VAKLAVRGTNIACFDEGRGEPPFVFLHGWACDHTFWQPQFDDLKRDHRCVAVDFRGRGASDATPPYDTTTLADDVAEVMRELKLGPAIVVGHSLGGLVALLLNERHPELVCGTVLGDSPLTSAGRGAFERSSCDILAAGSMEPARNTVESFFVEETPHDIREQVRKAMLGCPFEVGAGMLSNGDVFVEGLDRMIKEADRKPFMAIWASRPLGDPEHVRAITMFVRQEPIVGAGHFFQLEQPQVTNALLRAFVDDVLRDPRLAKAARPGPGPGVE
jgi:pimeloyl-ACP methyl ester carboxylesterase